MTAHPVPLAASLRAVLHYKLIVPSTRLGHYSNLGQQTMILATRDREVMEQKVWEVVDLSSLTNKDH